MVVVSIRPLVEFGPNDHREDAPHFIWSCVRYYYHVSRKRIEINSFSNVIKKLSVKCKTNQLSAVSGFIALTWLVFRKYDHKIGMVLDLNCFISYKLLVMVSYHSCENRKKSIHHFFNWNNTPFKRWYTVSRGLEQRSSFPMEKKKSENLREGLEHADTRKLPITAQFQAFPLVFKHFFLIGNTRRRPSSVRFSQKTFLSQKRD